MLQQRSGSQSNIGNNAERSNQQRETPTSAQASAISCPSELGLRVPCYCEENVWRLAHRRLFGPTTITNTSTTDSDITVDKENEQYYVVFISNSIKCCPMFHQRASQNVDEPCFWDYHVILIHSSSSSFTQVLDMDSRLDYPCTLDEYIQNTFQYDFIDNNAARKYSPMFRVIRAESFLRHFSSNRMHMFQDGKWSSPPPNYDCILADEHKNKKGSVSNLNDYIQMNGNGIGKDSSIMGDVVTLKEFRARFTE